MTPERFAPVTALAALAILLAASPSLAADDGEPDPSYGSSGVARVDLAGGEFKPVRSVACGADGRCYMIGEYALTDSEFYLEGFSADGDAYLGVVITAFDLGGNLDDQAWDLAVQPDGKIVVVGYAIDGAGSDDRRMAVARYTPNLVLDPTFDGDGRATINFNGRAEALAVAIAPDGKIVVAGYYDSGVNGWDFAIARLTSGGAPDNSFDGNGVRTFGFNLGGTLFDIAYDVALQPDGKIVVAGYAAFGGGDSDFALLRLTASGANDPGFDTDGALTVAFDLGTGDGRDIATAVAIDTAGRILVAGKINDGDDDRVGVIRRLANGAADGAFGEVVLGSSIALVPDLAVLPWPSKRILVSSFTGVYGLSDAGSLDPAFGAGGFALFDDPLQVNTFVYGGMAVLGGRPYVGGMSESGGQFTVHVVQRLWMDQIFGDGFAAGNRNAWPGY